MAFIEFMYQYFTNEAFQLIARLGKGDKRHNPKNQQHRNS